jgi:hypothetical protein
MGGEEKWLVQKDIIIPAMSGIPQLNKVRKGLTAEITY